VPDEEGWTPLHHAAHYCHVDVVRLLLAHPRVNVHARSKMGWTPLDTAGVFVLRKSECVSVIDTSHRMFAGNAAVATALLNAGANVAAPAGELAPLHHAVFHSRADVVAVLLSHGANASATVSLKAAQRAWSENFPTGGTALHIAAFSLNAARCYVNLRGGATFAPIAAPHLANALECAKRREAMVTSLIAAGVDVHARSPNDNSTALMLASQEGDLPVIRALLAGGARIGDTQRPRGATAIHFAAFGDKVDAIHALVAAGADLDRLAHNLRPACAGAPELPFYIPVDPLMLAVQCNKAPAVRALLELGADSTLAHKFLQSPMMAAINAETRELVARHRAGAGPAPARVCALPTCQARRRADYDDKKLKNCAACGKVAYCSKEHQVAHWKDHKVGCKAASKNP
jgi:ankyrin repeat protein